MVKDKTIFGNPLVRVDAQKQDDEHNNAQRTNGFVSISHGIPSLVGKHRQVMDKDKISYEKPDNQGLVDGRKQDDGGNNLMDSTSRSSSTTVHDDLKSIPILMDSSVKQPVSKSKPAEPSLVKNDTSKSDTTKDSILAKGRSNQSRLSIAVAYSPNYLSGFHLVDNPSGHAYGYDADDSRSKTRYSYTAGVAVRYDLASRLGISMGCTYSTIAYSMTLPTIYVGYGANWQLHYQYPTPCGNIEIPNTTNTILHYGDSLKTSTACTQVVRFINVPLTLRFQIARNRVKLYANAGVSVNFMLQEKANMTIGGGTQSTIINNIDGLQKTNYGYLLGAGLEYDFYRRVNLFIEPSFRGSISSLTQNTAYYCYPYTFGVNTGLSYHF